MTFAIYASKLFEVMKRHLPGVHAYADDNQLYISIKPCSSASELEALTASQDCILDIKTWMTADKLKLNDDKTELIVNGTRAQLDKIGISELSIDHVKVSAVCNLRNLVTWFDNHLGMKTPSARLVNRDFTICIILGALEDFLALKMPAD